LQRLNGPKKINENNLINVRSQTSRYFTNKRREYLKDKINQLAAQSNNKNEFNSSYQTTNNSMKEENGDLLADSHILNPYKN
jgi:hypothetical protein